MVCGFRDSAAEGSGLINTLFTYGFATSSSELNLNGLGWNKGSKDYGLRCRGTRSTAKGFWFRVQEGSKAIRALEIRVQQLGLKA